MSAVTQDVSPSTDIIPLVEANPTLVLLDREKFEDFYEAIRREVEAHKPDLSTDRGRKAVASLAYKVTRTKTAIDDAGKKLNEAARAQIAKVDESRREIRERLDALKDQARRPLTEWEEAEAAREERCAETMELLRSAAVVSITETSADVRVRLDTIKAVSLTVEDFGHGLSSAQALMARTVDALELAVERLEREERDRAELERLRAQEAERERAEAERRAKEEAERLAREQAEAAERKRLADEEAERERIAAAEARAREDAERRAREEAEAKDRAHQAEIERVRRETEERVKQEAEAAAKSERDRLAEEERVKRQELQQASAKLRRRRLLGEAKTALMIYGELDEESAKRVVLAIVEGRIPNVSIDV